MDIAVGTYQGVLHILHFDLQDIAPIKSMQLSQNSIKSVCFINNQHIVAGGYDQELRVIDAKTLLEKVEAKQNVSQITSIVQVDPTHFVCGVGDGTIRLWDINSWTISKQLRIHKKTITSIVSVMGKLMISSAANKVILWSSQGLKKMYDYKFAEGVIIENLFVSPCLQSLYLSNSKSQLIHVSTATNKQSILLSFPIPRKIQKFVIFKEFVLIANDLGQVMAWKIEIKEEGVVYLNYQSKIWFKAHETRIKDMKIIQDQWLFVATSAGDISVWDFPTFLDSVDGVSQQYFLDGLKPVSSYVVKGRILCFEILEKLAQEQKCEYSPQQELVGNVEKQDLKALKQKKAKKIQKKGKVGLKMQNKRIKNSKQQKLGFKKSQKKRNESNKS